MGIICKLPKEFLNQNRPDTHLYKVVQAFVVELKARHVQVVKPKLLCGRVKVKCRRNYDSYRSYALKEIRVSEWVGGIQRSGRDREEKTERMMEWESSENKTEQLQLESGLQMRILLRYSGMGQTNENSYDGEDAAVRVWKKRSEARKISWWKWKQMVVLCFNQMREIFLKSTSRTSAHRCVGTRTYSWRVFTLSVRLHLHPKAHTAVLRNMFK